MSQSSKVQRPVMDNSAGTTQLNEREVEVLKLLSDGFTHRAIAKAVGLSKPTIDKMLSNSDDARSIYRKIGAETRAGAIKWYLEREVQSRSPDVTEENTTRQTVTPFTQVTDRSNNIWQSPFLYAFTLLFICVAVLIFVPGFLRGGGDAIDSILINFYASLPAVAGIYGIRSFRRPEQQTIFFQIFRLFSLGLVLWALGSIGWMIYDLVEGLVPHYPSIADFGYFGQTILQVTCFTLWWREIRIRTKLLAFTWFPIAVMLLVPYYATLYSVRSVELDLTNDIARLVIDVLNTLGDSVSLSLALSILLPGALVVLTKSMKLVFVFMGLGMMAMFLAGAAFYVTVSLPVDHWLYYGGGGWPDLVFACALFLFGIGIFLANHTQTAFLDSTLLAPSTYVDEPSE